MPSPIKNVLLVGASGNIGVPVLSAFLGSGIFNVSVLSRAESTATFPPETKVIKSDFSPASLLNAFQGQDAVISMVGKEGFALQPALVDAAVAAGVKRFVPSEFGSNTELERVRELVPVMESKHAIIDYLKTKESSGLTWTALATGPFFDWCLRNGFFGFNIAEKTAMLWDGGDIPVSSTTLKTIAQALVTIFSKPDVLKQTANEFIYIASFTATQNEVLKILETSTGEKWKIKHVQAKPVHTAAFKKFAEGDDSLPVIADLVLSSAFSAERLNDFRSVGLWNDKLGLPKEDLEEEIKTAL